MLKSLSIRNIALIERAEISFSEGISVLSGETGAGKSVILDSIDFVLGAKADKSMIRFGQTECSVRAEFFVSDAEILRILEELDIETDETLVISRRLTLDGRGGAKVNGCAVTSAMLKRITSRLVDVHGQSEHFFLLKESNQLRLLDRVGGEKVASEKSKVGELLAKRKEILAQLSKLGGDDGERNRRLDILRFQIDEITRAAVKDGEDEELTALRDKFINAEKILSGLNAAREILLADGGATDLVNGAKRSLLQIAKYGDYGALAERLENVFAELNDVGESVEAFAEELDLDESELERIENRLDEIKSLKKKYGGSIAAMNEFLSRAREEYDFIKDSAARIEEFTAELSQCEEKLFAACLLLTKERKEAAQLFSERVVEELKTLNIASAQFEVQFDEYSREDVGRATAEGLGGIRFLFSANAGEPLKELGKIISGGEMSRFMLAVKAQLTSLGEIGTYIFDEIDAGIGGRTAKVVAEKFCKIAMDTQIIAVSHLAQIAASADKQFLIEKIEEGDKTYTRLKELSFEERRMELARLIAGDRTELSLRHADEFLKSAENYKNSLSR